MYIYNAVVMYTVQ